MDNIIIKEVKSNHPHLHELINKLDKELKDRYPEEGIYGLDFSDPKVKDTFFIVAYVNNISVGCGAIRPLNSDSVELKRLYVHHDYRKKGIASKLLKYLEDTAKRKGYHNIKLETGPYQPESIVLYEKNGYEQIELFGEYDNSKYSICFEKKI